MKIRRVENLSTLHSKLKLIKHAAQRWLEKKICLKQDWYLADIFLKSLTLNSITNTTTEHATVEQNNSVHFNLPFESQTKLITSK